VGALAQVEGNHIKMTGVVANRTGTRLFRDEIFGMKDQGERLGEALADRLLERGAGELLLPMEKENVPPGSA
jgi:hydroxymethylbilane synthase